MYCYRCGCDTGINDETISYYCYSCGAHHQPIGASAQGAQQQTGSAQNESDMPNRPLVVAAWMYVAASLLAGFGGNESQSILMFVGLIMIVGAIAGVIGAGRDIQQAQRHHNVWRLMYLTLVHFAFSGVALWASKEFSAESGKWGLLTLVVMVEATSPFIYTLGRQWLLSGSLKPRSSTTRHLLYACYAYLGTFVLGFLIGFLKGLATMVR